ncbi:MAG: hypothetical protein JO145_04125 [Acidobacteriaceae bacterium]|nr:hypothetical protein [Acidobacteriaceae bacterium]
MGLQVRPETEARINALAAASGVSVDEYLAALVNRQFLDEESASSPQKACANGPQHPIWEVIAENMKDVPPEDFAALPKDGLSQIDHYVYGVPKRSS